MAPIFHKRNKELLNSKGGKGSLCPSCGARFFLSALLTLAAFFFTACRSEKTASAPPPPVVTVIEVVRKDTPITFEYVAQTQSSHLVNIQARVNGFLDKRVYTEGEIVKEGQVLFRMDPKPFQAQLDQARAALLIQEATFETARLNLARTRPLTEQNALSKKDLDDATGQYQSSAAAVEQARAQVETAKLNLSYATITSPVTGISSSARQTEGTYIGTQNSLLTTVAVLSPIWVNFSLSENDMVRYRDEIARGLLRPPKSEGYEIEIVLVDGSVYPHRGKMTFAEPSFNPQTGTFMIRASVDNPKGLIRPNQYVRARLLGACRPNSILVPQRAVQQGSKGLFVWVVGKQNRVEERPVTVGEWRGNDWFIFEGLRGGEKVVVDGGLMLHPGSVVSAKAPEAVQPTAGTSITPPKTDAVKR
jgi:membrane fusion protein, multidrug efflux system